MGAGASATLTQSSSSTIPSARSNNTRRKTKKRFNIDKGKLNNILSCGFTARAAAREVLLGERLHSNKVHNFMTRNCTACVREKYTGLSDKNLLEIIGEALNGFRKSGRREVVTHLRNRNPLIQIQKDRCARLLIQSDPVGTAKGWV